jgi:hypothetical protein
MIFPILALLLTAAQPAEPPRSVTLYDDTVIVGPSRFRTLDLDLPEEPARVVCSFEVLNGGSSVRAVLLKREDADRWLRGEAHNVEADTPFARRGAFSHKPADPDHYLIVLDNRLEARSATEVHLLVRILHNDGPSGPISTADPRKGQLLVWSSFSLFAALAIFSGRELHTRLQRRLKHRA